MFNRAPKVQQNFASQSIFQMEAVIPPQQQEVHLNVVVTQDAEAEMLALIEEYVAVNDRDVVPIRDHHDQYELADRMAVDFQLPFQRVQAPFSNLAHFYIDALYEIICQAAKIPISYDQYRWTARELLPLPLFQEIFMNYSTIYPLRRKYPNVPREYMRVIDAYQFTQIWGDRPFPSRINNHQDATSYVRIPIMVCYNTRSSRVYFKIHTVAFHNENNYQVRARSANKGQKSQLFARLRTTGAFNTHFQ